MNEKYKNGNYELEITDAGITHKTISINNTVFFPYGSMDSIEYGLWGLTIKSGKMFCSYSPSKDEKKKLKNLLSTLVRLNQSAERTKPIVDFGENVEKNLEKNLDSFKNYFNNLDEKHEYDWNKYITQLLDSMTDDEEIIHGFQGDILNINGENDIVTNFIAVITNKRFCYIGKEGKAVLTYFKAGSVELKDAHAVSIADTTLTSQGYVQFEVKNDNYRFTTGAYKQAIKDALEKSIKECESSNANTTIIQATVSVADELKKFKELLDMGIITQEEFDTKKKQLLGL